MNKLIQNSIFYLVVFCVTYFIYVYPFEILNELLFNVLFLKYLFETIKINIEFYFEFKWKD